jgi:hypothetical protein
MVNKYTAYGVAAGVGGSFFFPGPLITGFAGGGAWLLSRNKNTKTVGKGVVIGAVATTIVTVALLGYLVSTIPASYKVVVYPTVMHIVK